MNAIILTDEMIDHLIGARNRMTDRRDEMIDFRAVDHIDAVLSAVPQGQRPDIDALLGRKRIIAVQHADGRVEIDDPRPGYIVNPAAQMWGWMGDDTITTGEIAELEARCDETDGNREER